MGAIMPPSSCSSIWQWKTKRPTCTGAMKGIATNTRPVNDLLARWIEDPRRHRERACGLVHVEDLAPHVRPAGHLHGRRGAPVPALVERVEARIAIGLQKPAEALQVRTRVLALAVRRVAVEHRRRRAAPVGTLVAHVDP